LYAQTEQRACKGRESVSAENLVSRHGYEERNPKADSKGSSCLRSDPTLSDLLAKQNHYSAQPAD
jgi:hypothetical protein